VNLLRNLDEEVGDKKWKVEVGGAVLRHEEVDEGVEEGGEDAGVGGGEELGQS
jgi:hypothetical protein